MLQVDGNVRFDVRKTGDEKFACAYSFLTCCSIMVENDKIGAEVNRRNGEKSAHECSPVISH